MAVMHLVAESFPSAGFVIFALVTLGAFLYTKVFLDPLAKVPGPWYSKYTDVVLKRLWLGGSKTQYVHDLHKKYGPVVRISPHEVDVLDVPAAKEIHSVKATYAKAPWYRTFATPGTENVFSTTDIDFHRRHRRLLQGPLSETNLKVFHPVVEQRVDLAIQRMKEETKTRGATDVLKWFLFLATDTVGELTFGESFRTLESGEKNEYTKNLETHIRTGAKRTTFPLIAKIGLYIPIPGFRDTTDVVRKNIQFAEDSLKRYQILVEKDPENPPPTLFTKLFKGEEDDILTMKEIRDEAMVYILAGSDTTALTLTYLVWAVCRDAAIRTRLVDELAGLHGSFDDAELRRLPYLNQVIDEALRLYASAPAGLPRVVPPGGATLAGYSLPAGTVVSTQAYSMHRIEEIFPDPETFNPSRWEGATKDMRDASMPWGGGSRICLGIHLARLELRLAVARFFTEFPGAKVSRLDGMCDDDMEPKIFFMMAPKNKRCLIECR
ncbi:hypothetical protein INS49_004031 [Diaporthe citri]|uniref:uncharacterized protein n=1 Tax=Diaporthe citri TaxID=83186 RepID=UPI001C7F8EF2|nr:uncharacterized protein INS49_004031 [Diaporthe citri]KAG6354950.1 hypothetical protein INS49_004031 [Diaporthe citri]